MSTPLPWYVSNILDSERGKGKGKKQPTPADREHTYMIHGNKPLPIAKHHNLVFDVPDISILPLVNSHLFGFRAVIARHVEDAAARRVAFAITAGPLFSYTHGGVDAGVRRCGAGVEPGRRTWLVPGLEYCWVG